MIDGYEDITRDVARGAGGILAAWFVADLRGPVVSSIGYLDREGSRDLFYAWHHWSGYKAVRDTGLGVTHYVDMRSIRAGNGFRQAWVKDVPTEGRNGVREYRALYEFNCREPSMRMLQFVTYMRDGTTHAAVGTVGWIRVFLDSEDTSDVVHRAVCRSVVR